MFAKWDTFDFAVLAICGAVFGFSIWLVWDQLPQLWAVEQRQAEREQRAAEKASSASSSSSARKMNGNKCIRNGENAYENCRSKAIGREIKTCEAEWMGALRYCCSSYPDDIGNSLQCISLR